GDLLQTFVPGPQAAASTRAVLLHPEGGARAWISSLQTMPPAGAPGADARSDPTADPRDRSRAWYSLAGRRSPGTRASPADGPSLVPEASWDDLSFVSARATSCAGVGRAIRRGEC